MVKYDFENVVNILKEIVFNASKFLTKARDDNIYIREKSSFKDIVTSVDVKTQTFIINEIKQIYRNACFIAEEMNNNNECLRSELSFVIDPIDGTANFVKGMKYSCISIGCFSYGELMAGIVYNPYADEMFCAVKGHGAYLNDMKISVSKLHISESFVLFGTSPYNIDATENTFDKLKKIYIKCLDIRRLGSAALDICNVACGRVGLYFEAKLSLWDYAAASIILSEAGGMICDYNGYPIKYSLEKSSVVAGSELIIKESEILES